MGLVSVLVTTVRATLILPGMLPSRLWLCITTAVLCLLLGTCVALTVPPICLVARLLTSRPRRWCRQPTIVLLTWLLLTWIEWVQIMLFSDSIVILAALLLTLMITSLAGLATGTFVLTVVVTGLETRLVPWVLVDSIDRWTVCPLIGAVLRGM